MTHKNKKKTKVWIQKAESVHGDRYDYSKVDYVNAKSKIDIVCLEHGTFKQTPNDHLNGHGCRQCAGYIMYSYKDFLKLAISIHGAKYKYTSENYLYSKNKILIECNKHGYFEQSPSAHLRCTLGCPECAEYARRESKIENNRQRFYKKLNLLYPADKYDFKKTIYVKSKLPVNVYCRKHGNFTVLPKTLLKGVGCLKCRENPQKSTTIDFIQKAIRIHEDEYDYSKVKYISNNKKVVVICRKHGNFTVRPNNHLQGQKCRMCCSSFSLSLPAYVYMISVRSLEYSNFIGYGITNSKYARLRTHKLNLTAFGYSIEKIHKFYFSKGVEATMVENFLKATYKPTKTNVPGFKTENFNVKYYNTVKRLLTRFSSGKQSIPKHQIFKTKKK